MVMPSSTFITKLNTTKNNLTEQKRKSSKNHLLKISLITLEMVQLFPIVCNDGFDAAEHGTCADNGTINDKDYLDEEILEAMGFDYGFDPNKNYVKTFMDAKSRISNYTSTMRTTN